MLDDSFVQHLEHARELMTVSVGREGASKDEATAALANNATVAWVHELIICVVVGLDIHRDSTGRAEVGRRWNGGAEAELYLFVEATRRG